MDTERIDELEKLAKAASGGTWRAGNQKPSDNDELLQGMFFHTNRIVDKEQAWENAEFLTESRDAVLELCKEARKLQHQLDAAKTKLATIRATATQGVPHCINLAAIDRIIGKEPAGE